MAQRPKAGLGGADAAALAQGVRDGDRRALARAITLIESTRADHRSAAAALIRSLLPANGRSLRIGITGVPGVGKSTLIEVLGLQAITKGHRVAVLAIDPTSPRTGGSILGDKTRMERLTRAPDAFIRPSPSGGALGGIARRTHESVAVAEAAGFDVILVETVGVGQSETAVARVVDMFILLLSPAGGDELQGIKRGIVEMADLILVNKADGALVDAAERTRKDYGNALHLLRPASAGWTPKVMTCSAREGTALADVWSEIEAFRAKLEASGELGTRRRSQALGSLWDQAREAMTAALRADPKARHVIERAEADVAAGKMAPADAALRILAAFKSTD
ncbi:MAG: methylmalonyl Co-A mutase-associated GTPase MeaB [Rhodospirillales bacterium]|nr:methylmalonyl Co-A mutase-associated GTPase MeaB [Rhodospirillales bacterium]